MQETQVRSLGQEDPLEKEVATTALFLPGKSHGQRSLVGYIPWGHKGVGHDLETKQQYSEHQDTPQNSCRLYTKSTLVAQTVKRLPAMRETRFQSPGREDALEKEMAPHSSTLAWKIPWTEEPGRLQSTRSQRVGHD